MCLMTLHGIATLTSFTAIVYGNDNDDERISTTNWHLRRFFLIQRSNIVLVYKFIQSFFTLVCTVHSRTYVPVWFKPDERMPEISQMQYIYLYFF